jgi:hypothetical protein
MLEAQFPETVETQPALLAQLNFLLCCRCCQALVRRFFFPAFFGRYVTWPRLVWRLPVALGPIVSNDLLSVRVHTPVTQCSLRLSTSAGRPVGGDPIYTTACFARPEMHRAASTSTQAEAGRSTAKPLTPL